MKPDERALLLELARLQTPHHGAGIRPGGEFATTAGQRLGLHPRRTEYLLGKWAGKGWWDYGVSLRTGWLTPAGLAEAGKPG